MDCGNWFVTGMPAPLREIVETYQDDMHFPSFSSAVRRLLETHPDIVKRIERVYAGSKSSP